jgi:hypothetical protein
VYINIGEAFHEICDLYEGFTKIVKLVCIIKMASKGIKFRPNLTKIRNLAFIVGRRRMTSTAVSLYK